MSATKDPDELTRIAERSIGINCPACVARKGQVCGYIGTVEAVEKALGMPAHTAYHPERVNSYAAKILREVLVVEIGVDCTDVDASNSTFGKKEVVVRLTTQGAARLIQALRHGGHGGRMNAEREKLRAEVDRLSKELAVLRVETEVAFAKGYDQAVGEIERHFKSAGDVDVAREIARIWAKEIV